MINNNSFYILDVNSYDNKNKIAEKAEELELISGDSDIISDATNKLMHPKKRIEAELDWIYFDDEYDFYVDNDIDIRTIIQKYTEKFDYDLFYAHYVLYDSILNEYIDEDDLFNDYKYPFVLTPLSCINILIELSQKKHSLQELEQILFLLSVFFDYISDPELVLRPINNAREYADFQQYTDETFVKKYLKDKYYTCIQQLFKSFKQYPFQFVVQLTTNFEENNETNNFHNDFIDEYRSFVHNELYKGIEDINQILERITSILSQNSLSNISNEIDTLIKLVGKWDTIAQPIQLNFNERGLNDDISENLANKLRSFAIKLHNEYTQTLESAKLIKAIKKYFQELEEIDELLNTDIKTIDDIIKRMQMALQFQQQLTNEQNAKKQQQNNGCGCLILIIIFVIILIAANS